MKIFWKLSAPETIFVWMKAWSRHITDLTGKVKIIRKPRPVGNEIKDISDARTHIVVRLELNEGRQRMQEKEFVPEYGATTATVLRLTKDFQGTGRTVIADSYWFGSVKSAAELMKVGLYSIMVVKTAHKNFPRELLNETELERGECGLHLQELMMGSTFKQ